ncbi:hypothetical protein ONZ51_g12485 [Trametes cubensis]|uniref:Uncharacterized protein n=1 Tax=Trametes cubensis TaxID=1111947 RepID=A0AAD7TH39_9APHY|nr:hypothetical protein ONZ51_g12485 [Trametes cubensis]
MDDFIDLSSFPTHLESPAMKGDNSSDMSFLGPDGVPVNMELSMSIYSRALWKPRIISKMSSLSSHVSPDVPSTSFAIPTFLLT